MIKVNSQVPVYEDCGVPVKGDAHIDVSSHWNRSELVVIEVGDRRLTVAARDLLAAIANATNSGRL